MKQIKVGDKVICVDNTGRIGDLILGKIYTVRHSEHNSVWVEEIFSKCRANRFKPAKKELKNKPGEFY